MIQEKGKKMKITEIKLVESADVPIIKLCYMGIMIDISIN